MYFRGEGGEVLRGDVLCMRNPCHLPSDVQVYGAVHKPELAGYHNVCVFSTAGPGPGMAARLSGGDYDGDVVTMIWDDRLVGQVRRDLCGVPAELPGVAAAFERTPPPTVGEVLASEGMEGLAQRAWKAYVGGEEDMLGMYTRWHAMVAEHEGVASERAVELAQMCQRLVDAPKTGDRLLPEAEQRHRMFAEPLPKLFWWDLRQASKSKGKTPSRPAAAVPGPTSFLHDLAAGLVPMPPLFKERMDELLLRKAPLDEHLLAPLASLPSDPATQRDLELLKRAVTATYKRYNSFFAQRYNDAPQTPGKSEGRKIAEFKQRLEADFRGIGTEGMESLVWTSADTRLKVLGAIAYQLTRSAPPVPGKPEGSGQFCWEMALDALCQIKAYHEHNDGRTGPPRFPWAVPWTIARFLRLRWGK
ncbi:RNA dependent RNA polymerase-domain-containing protein [Hyaloraphidium curvatum]|nr:RNA dependent RNA polymerase-domain-containing protein [Hyaloraphidium curvatum]